jgi:P27 family predicted phage terminase small subunit
MGRPPKPIEEKRRNGRSAGRDSGGRKLPASSTITQLPGSSDTPPVPAELSTKDLAGKCFIARGRRMDDDPQPCEACLAEPGVEAWNRLWSAGRSWLSVATDIDVLKRICKARIDEAHLRIALAEDGPHVAGQRGGLVAHPAFSQLRMLNAEVVKLESLCGFNPSDRSRLGVAEVKGASAFEQLLTRRAAPRRTAEVSRRAAPRRRAVGSGEDPLD